MSSPSEFTSGAPYFASPSRPDLLAGAEMINFGSVLAPGSGQQAGFQPSPRLPYGHAFRKRRSSPASGPALKRRATEESMIGDLQNLSLNSMQERQQQSQFSRWQELEARLADQLANEEEQQQQKQQQHHQTLQPRIVLSDELQKIVSSPGPDLIPDTKSGSPCTALVIWQPPPLCLPEQPAEKEKPPDERPATQTSDQPPPPPPPPAAAYDFSSFRRPGAAQQPPAFLFGAGGASAFSPAAPGAATYQFGTAPAPGAATCQFGTAPAPGAATCQFGAALAPGAATCQFGTAPAPGTAGVGTAPPTFAGCLSVPLPADDESMEL